MHSLFVCGFQQDAHSVLPVISTSRVSVAAKKPEDQLFETMDATDLNKTLKDLMDGLSVKVFRTYNASITLDRLVWEPSDSEVVDAKKADYDRANKEVHAHSLTIITASWCKLLVIIFTSVTVTHPEAAA